MKKKAILVSIYSSVLIIGLVLFLIFFPTKTENKNELPKNNYATSLRLNCPNEIFIPTDSSFTFNSGYISIAPAEMEKEIKVEVIAKNSSPADGLIFDKDTITAMKIGEYNVKFSAPSKSGYIYDSLIVNVVEDNADIIQIKNNIQIDEEVDIFEVLKFNSTIDNFTVKDNSYYDVLEDKIIPLGIVYIGYPDEEKESRTQYNEQYIHII